MKKLTIGRTYKIVEDIIPPVILRSLKKTRTYRKMASTAKDRLQSDYAPSWQTISAGPLKGVQLYVDPRGEWQKEMLSGIYDKFFFNFLSNIDLKGKTVYDIGAHIGFDTLYFSHHVGHGGHVIAFEPNAINIERINMILSKNTELGKRVIVMNKAISNAAGTTDFFMSNVVEDGSSFGGFINDAHTVHEKDSYEKSRGFHQVTVDTTSIDELIASKKYSVPDIIKIDIEGAEYLAIEGATNLLKTHRPILLIEIHSIFNMLTIGEILRDLKYHITLLNEEPNGRCFIAAEPHL